MCIIIVKPRGVKLPDESRLRRCWTTNPDGAGYAYVDKRGRVQIRKGYMTYDDLLTALDALGRAMRITDVPMILHFRITTHGKTCRENCHPFPLTDDLRALKSQRHTGATAAIAHNGIITAAANIKQRGISDTMAYIADTLSELERVTSIWDDTPVIIEMVRRDINGSRLAILRPDGRIRMIGSWQRDESDGCYYSNGGYKMPTYTYRRVSYPVAYYSYKDGKYVYDYTGADEGEPDKYDEWEDDYINDLYFSYEQGLISGDELAAELYMLGYEYEEEETAT
jgi:predicted glutamine amidotransferase